LVENSPEPTLGSAKKNPDFGASLDFTKKLTVEKKIKSLVLKKSYQLCKQLIFRDKILS